TDPGPSPNSSTDTAHVIALADLSVTKTGPSTAAAADAKGINYSLTMTNSGPSDNTGGFVVTDTLSPFLTFQTYGSSSACSAAGQIVTCTNTTGLAASASQAFTIHVKLSASTPNGTDLTNSAAVASTGTTDTPGNNTSNTTHTAVTTSADLSLTKVDSADPVVAGFQFTYTMTVSNSGPSDAQAATLTDGLPSGLTVASYTASQGACATTSTSITCIPGTIAAAGSATVTVTGNTDPADSNKA